MSEKIQICVIGAGVNGLAAALQILEAFPTVDLTVMGAELSPNTTGDGSAGFWEPYLLVNTPDEDVKRRSRSTFEFLVRLLHSEDGHKAGIEFLSGFNFFPEKVEDPIWKDEAFGFRHATRRELELMNPKAKHGWFYTSIICTVDLYLPWLMDRIQQRGGRIIQRKVNSIQELAGKYDVIVNCSGLGSYFLFNDKSMEPIQGQVLKVVNTACKSFVLAFSGSIDDGADTYILPGKNAVTLGGTAVKGVWDTNVNPETSRQILERCCKIMPSLKMQMTYLKIFSHNPWTPLPTVQMKVSYGRVCDEESILDGFHSNKHATITKEWVGLRPGRKDGIRLERETKMVNGHKVHIVHNYGHGGCGVTLHWGCAEDVVKLVRECLQSSFQSRL